MAPLSSLPHQFNATPRFSRFSFGSSNGGPQDASPAGSRYATPGRPPARAWESIEDAEQDPQINLHESIESAGSDVVQEVDLPANAVEEDDDQEGDPRSPKRRRLSSSPIGSVLSSTPLTRTNQPSQEAENDDTEDDELFFQSSPVPVISSPPLPKASHHRGTPSTAAPRFILPSAVSSTIPLPPTTPGAGTSNAFLKAPRFIPPDQNDANSGPRPDPLPEAFSPHRRGAKYLAGGLASEVRDWLVNIEGPRPSMSVHTEMGTWSIRIMVDAVSGGADGGMTMIRGSQIHSEGGLEDVLDHLGSVRVILAGEGLGGRASAVGVGKIVGIKGAVWDVVLQDEKWGVGVDWKVLS